MEYCITLDIHIPGRKRHYRLNKIEQSQKQVYFFDESRFGTHSQIGHAGFKPGNRARLPYKLGFKSFYLSATSETGQDYTFISDVFNKALVMDDAPWHKGLNAPRNIEI